LHESDLTRLRLIQEAIKKIDYGEYGECVRCGEDINEKQLVAVPWAAMCIRCQEEISQESVVSPGEYFHPRFFSASMKVHL